MNPSHDEASVRMVLGRRRQVTPSGCWEWTGARRAGYGRIRIRRRLETVHRVSWELDRGDVPDGWLVLHRCDNPPCFNPDHLFLGMAADNSRDMSIKGRAAGRRLSTDEARAVRAFRRAGHSLRTVAAIFDVDQRSVRLIDLRRSYVDAI